MKELNKKANLMRQNPDFEKINTVITESRNNGIYFLCTIAQQIFKGSGSKIQTYEKL